MNSLVNVSAIVDRPFLSDVLAELGPLPREAMFTGIATDDLPVLLNLHDPVPGPILVISDQPTEFLITLAEAAVMMHSPNDLQFNILSDLRFDWQGPRPPHMVGNYSFDEVGAANVVDSLATWAHANKNPKQSVLLLTEGLQNIERLGFDAVQNFRWLLLRGPARRVWPIVTLDARGFSQSLSWLGVFHTRIYGRIQDPKTAKFFGAEPEMVSTLANCQFVLKEGSKWLKFVLPNI